MIFSSTLLAAIAFSLVSIASPSFGELLILRHPPTDNGSTRNLTCISENDGAALIWNYNFNPDPKSGKNVPPIFEPKRRASDNITKCATWNSKVCLVEWENIEEWNAVDSAIKPMGPALDYRWEDFKEFVSDENMKYRYVRNMTKSSDAAIFSVRGFEDVNIFLSRDEHAVRSPCLWITIGKGKGSRSTIRSCPNGAPAAEQFQNTERCRTVATVTHKFKELLNDYEWRTFGIKWINAKKIIQVFKDTQNEPFLQGYLEQWHSMSHITTIKNGKLRFRFHYYSYLLTKNKDALMSTKKFEQNDKNFCVEMLVGLCPKCQLKINIVGNGDRDIGMKIISGNDESVYDGMLPWKLVKLNANSQISDRELVKLEIRTIHNEDKGEGQWAIDNIRVCESIDIQRKSIITYHKEKLDNSNDKHWPEVNCQKLSYTKSVTVKSQSHNAIDQEENQLDQFLQKSVNLCGKLCKNFAKSWSSCNSMGCACNRGYNGLDCTTKCSSGTYGYNCNKKCGSCQTGVCDEVNGHCNSGCRNSTLLPPFCKKELETPKVVRITDTSVKINVNVEPEEFKWFSSLAFEIRGIPAGESRVYPAIKTGPSTYEANITNLQPQNNYTVYTVANIDKAGQVTSSKIYFTTTSTDKFGERRCINVVTGEKHLTLEYNKNSECANRLGAHYALKLRKPPKEEYPEKYSPPLPYTFTDLQPYTEYEVIISIKGGSILTERVRTLESAPSKIRNLTIISSSDTKATINWDPPLETNGVITSYTVLIKLDKLLGCAFPEKQTPPQHEISHKVKDPTISLSGLRPYARYTVTVIPRTTKEGIKETYNFETEQKYIPTSVVNNLHFENENRTLVWNRTRDCTKITGYTSRTRLVFTKVNDSGKNLIYRKDTNETRFDLSSIPLVPYTLYNVRAHVIRDRDGPENLNLYQELTWRTPKAAPPGVKNFKVYDADTETNSISLRWEPPDPPNGELEFYTVSITNRDPRFKPRVIKNSKEIKPCDLWANHVCLENFTLQKDVETSYVVEVYAKNKDVNQLGNTSRLEFLPSMVYNEAPGKPVNLTETCSSQGIVSLKWTHPFSPTKITEYVIKAQFLNSSLREYPYMHSPSQWNYRLVKNQKDYSKELHLASSSTYNISITSINRQGFKSTELKRISTQNSFDFMKEEKLEYVQIKTVIKLKIPFIVNTTRDTTVNVIVKGPLNCTMNNSSKKSPSFDEREITVATYETGNNTPKNVTIDTNEITNEGFNCSLPIGEPYDIEIVVKDRANHSLALIVKVSINQTDNINLIFISTAIVIVTAISSLMFFIYLRKRNRTSLKTRQQNILQLKAMMMGSGNSTVPCTLNRESPSPKATINRVSIRQSSPDVVPLYNPNSCPVKVEEFEEHTKEALARGLLDPQYALFAESVEKPCEYAKLPENLPKNRYKDRIPYDDTRVVLRKIPGESNSDYINASYIQGYRKRKAYIATQGPKQKTVKDFWRMIWQEEVRVICMLANILEGGKKKCEQYWPEIRTKVQYGNILISNKSHQVFADYTFRTFTLNYKKETRVVTHLHYTGWPDHGVPMYTQSLVAYLKKLLATPAGKGPVVVHCSAGVGRTGTIILCDICLRQAFAERVIDVPAVILKMREDRANMVDNAQQYLLAHLAIVESMVIEQTQIPCTELFPERIMELRKQLPSDIKRLQDTVWQDQALHSLELSKHITKGEVATDRLSRVVSASPASSRRNMINAVSVDGVKMKNQYLALRQPSTSTLSDFWKLIAEKNIELVVILQRPNTKDSTCCDITPGESIFVPTSNIQVETKGILEEEEHFTIDTLTLTDTSEKEDRKQPVTVVTCTGWGRGKTGKPPTAAALVSLWIASEKIPRKEGPTLVLCRDGVTGCGLYLALSFLLERIAVERECDVISAVRAVRRSKTEFVQSQKQFEYLYDAAVYYVKCFETYANFT